jgi:hypothetical protein
MPFPAHVKEKVLIACKRYCCLCYRQKSTKIEVHHIIPESDGGDSSFENAIPLCFECHAEVGHYNPQHPKGNKYSYNELKARRDELYAIVASGRVPPSLIEPALVQVVAQDAAKTATSERDHASLFEKRYEIYLTVRRIIERIADTGMDRQLPDFELKQMTMKLDGCQFFFSAQASELFQQVETLVQIHEFARVSWLRYNENDAIRAAEGDKMARVVDELMRIHRNLPHLLQNDLRFPQSTSPGPK